MPEPGSNRARRARPPSTTTRMSGKVSEVSAIEVASTILRPQRAPAPRAAPQGPSRRTAAGSCSPAVAQQRLDPADLALAGQEDQHAALGLLQRLPHQRRHRRLEAQRGIRGRGSQRVSTGKARPSAVITGAPPISAATGAASSVADITTSARSGRSARAPPAQGQAKVGLQAAFVKFVEDHAPTPGNSASDWIIRVRMPSVTTSIRVAAETRASPRMR
jgi:hypothetical protein